MFLVSKSFTHYTTPGEKGNKKTPLEGRCSHVYGYAKIKPADNFSRNESSGAQWPGGDWPGWTRIVSGDSPQWNDPWLQLPVWLKKLWLQSRVISVHSYYLTSLITSLSTDSLTLVTHFCWIAPLASVSNYSPYQKILLGTIYERETYDVECRRLRFLPVHWYHLFVPIRYHKIFGFAIRNIV